MTAGRPVFMEFPNFGYGPAAAALTLIRGVEDAYQWNLVSTGGAAAFAQKQLRGAVVHDLDTFDPDSWKGFREIAPAGSATVSVTNPQFGIWAAGAGYRVGLVDTLDWMWPSLPPGVGQVQFHLVQAYFGNNADGSRHNPKAQVIGPIVDPLLWPHEGAGRQPGNTVIGFGGMHMPSPGGDELVASYTRWFLDATLPLLTDHPKVKSVAVVGGRGDLEDLVPARWRNAVRVHPGLTRTDYAAMLRSAEHLLLSPGLGSLYECTSTHLQPLLQPGWNLSMLLQAFHVTRTAYPYICAWEWLGEAVRDVQGKSELDALCYLTGRIRDGIEEDRGRGESILIKPILHYLERTGPSPALQLEVSDVLPVAVPHFSSHLRSLFRPDGPERGGGGEPGMDPRQDHPPA
jgi:hypothetical protein